MFKIISTRNEVRDIVIAKLQFLFKHPELRDERLLSLLAVLAQELGDLDTESAFRCAKLGDYLIFRDAHTTDFYQLMGGQMVSNSDEEIEIAGQMMNLIVVR